MGEDERSQEASEEDDDNSTARGASNMLIHHHHLQRQEGDTSRQMSKEKLEKRTIGEGSRGLIDQVSLESKSNLAAIGQTESQAKAVAKELQGQESLNYEDDTANMPSGATPTQ